jgi:hypothetical protein
MRAWPGAKYERQPNPERNDGIARCLPRASPDDGGRGAGGAAAVEAETDLGRVRTLIMNAQSTLNELHELATKANAEAPKPG